MNTPVEWVERFPGLSRLDLPTKQLLLTRSTIVKVSKGKTIFGPRNSPENMLFLLDGTVRVQQISETGHQVVLYRIEAGQRCVLTTACLLSNGSCLLTLERGKIVLAEFGYDGTMLPSFPKFLVDSTKPERAACFLKQKMLPPTYWKGMLKGREWMAKPEKIDAE
jgi:hypothetical protein